MNRSLLSALFALIFVLVAGCVDIAAPAQQPKLGSTPVPDAILHPLIAQAEVLALLERGETCGDHRFDGELRAIGKDARQQAAAAFNRTRDPHDPDPTQQNAVRLREINREICATSATTPHAQTAAFPACANMKKRSKELPPIPKEDLFPSGVGLTLVYGESCLDSCLSGIVACSRIAANPSWAKPGDRASCRAIAKKMKQSSCRVDDRWKTIPK